MYETILYETADNVATITLNRPNVLNAVNDQMLAELGDALNNAGRDTNVRCLVLTGAGRAFCAGQDLADIQARGQAISYAEHLRQGYNPIIARMRRIEKPIIGAINGVAAGAGMSLALACDLRVASEKASFIQSFVNVGLVQDSGSSCLLPRLVGYARAFDLAVTGQKLEAPQALTWGLVNRVVKPEELAEAAHAWAVELALQPPKAVGLIKRAMNRAPWLEIEAALDYEAQLQEIAGRTADHREGVAAFLEKRKPVFQGK